MSVELRDIRRRISGTRQIRKVTSALQRMSTVQLAGDRRLLDPYRAYMERFRYLLREMFLAAPEIEHPLTHASAGKPVVLVVWGSDRGLCGGFNMALAAAAQAFRKDFRDAALQLVLVGRGVQRKTKRLGLVPFAVHRQPGRHARAAFLAGMAEDLSKRFTSGQVGEVHLLYMRFLSPMRQEPAREPLLPFQPRGWHLAATALPMAQGAGRLRTASQEPGPAVLANTLLPEFILRSLEHAYLHSLTSEDAARQIAMNRASQNASEMLSNLLRTFSRLRQETITTEMIEIAGGGLLQCPQEK